MQYHVFSEEYERQGILGSYLSSTWEEHYQQKGRFILHTSDTDDNARLLKVGNRLWQRGKKTSMIIEFTKTEHKRIAVYGCTALTRLNQRIINPTVNVTNVELGMKAIVRNNTRDLSHFRIDNNRGLPERFDSQFTGHELMEALEILGAESGLGYFMGFDPKAKQDVFTVYRGDDYSVGENVRMFSAEFRNLDALNIVDDISLYKNVAYVAGQGEGANRVIVIVGTATGSDRREMFVDARDIQQDMEIQRRLDRHESSLNRLADREGETLSQWQRDHLTQQIADFNTESSELGVSGTLSYNFTTNRFTPTIAQMRTNIRNRLSSVNTTTYNAMIAQLRQRGIERLNDRNRSISFTAVVSGDIGEVGDVIICRGRGITLKSRVMARREITEDNVTKTECVIGEPEITVFQEIKKTMR